MLTRRRRNLNRGRELPRLWKAEIGFNRSGHQPQQWRRGTTSFFTPKNEPVLLKNKKSVLIDKTRNGGGNAYMRVVVKIKSTGTRIATIPAPQAARWMASDAPHSHR